MKTLEVVSDGILNLKFAGVVQNPFVSGIQIRRLPDVGNGGGTLSSLIMPADFVTDSQIDDLFEGGSGVV